MAVGFSRPEATRYRVQQPWDRIYLDCTCEIGGLLRPFWEPLRALSDADGGSLHRLKRIDTHSLPKRLSRPAAVSPSGSQARGAGFIERKGAMNPLSLSVVAWGRVRRRAL